MTDLPASAHVFYWLRGQPTQNFGDFLTEYFLAKLLMGPRIYAAGYRLVGSVLENRIIQSDLLDADAAPGGRMAYWSCGMREDKPLNPELQARCHFFGVRGPLTRDLLRLGPDTTLGDAGFLIPLIHQPRPNPRSAGLSICVPHFNDNKSDEDLLACAGTDMVVRPAVQNTFESLVQILDEIAGARFVLAGSLHAAIVACAYEVPFAFWDNGHVDIPFKWRDLAASLGIPPAFVSDRQQGETVYNSVLQPKLRKPKLLPILEACPFYVRPSGLIAALAADELVPAQAAAIVSEALRHTVVETGMYAESSRRMIGRLSALQRIEEGAVQADNRRLKAQQQVIDKIASLQDGLKSDIDELRLHVRLDVRQDIGAAQTALEDLLRESYSALIEKLKSGFDELRLHVGSDSSSAE